MALFPLAFLKAFSLPRLLIDEFWASVFSLFTLVFALNSVVALRDIKPRFHGAVVLWFAMMVCWTILVLSQTFQSALHERDHPMPNGGIGAR